jgi:molecular chaperone Hsp33
MAKAGWHKYCTNATFYYIIGTLIEHIMTKKDSVTDTLQRFIFDKAPVRGEYIHLEQSFQTIINQHPYPEPIRKLLGEALCVAGLLRAVLKFDGRLTVQFHGKGKLKLLLAQCDTHFHIRGLAKCDDDISYEDLMESFNQGILVIMLDSGPSKRYQGIVSWRGDSLAESIEGYFKDSEQLLTKIWLAVSEKSAAGYLLQVIPDNTNDATQTEWQRIIGVTQDLKDKEILTEDYQHLLSSRYPDDDIRIFPPVDVAFKCTCSKKRSEDAILILGRKEAEEELHNKQMLVITCDFCNQEYVFDRGDVAHIFANEDQPPSQTKH